jgi:hypothetical protein
VFDLEAERERRAHLNALWNRSKEDEMEEIEIRKELKQVEAQLRKLKKSGAHIMAAAASKGASNATGATAGVVPGSGPAFAPATSSAVASVAPSAASSRNPSRSVSPTTAASLFEATAVAVDHVMNSTAPVPTARTPYLQSGRLSPPNAGGGVGGISGSAGINKSLLARMDAVLEELKVDVSSLVPTKRVCDLYDVVRRDVLTLLVLQKNLFQKEAALESKRLKLSKMGGSLSGATPPLDEEALMGIVPPPPAPAAASAAGTTGNPMVRGAAAGTGGAAGSSGKSKGKQLKSPGSGKQKSTAAGTKQKGAPSDDTVNPGAKKGKESKDPKKPAGKRKRNKSDASTAGTASKMPPPTAGVATAEAGTETSAALAASTSAATPMAAPSSGSATQKSDDSKPAKKRAKKSAPPAS